MADDPEEFSSELDFIIEARPRITVFPTPDGDVRISTLSINEDRERVEVEGILIPQECIAQVAAALQRIVNAK